MAGFSVICCVVNMGEASRTLKNAKKYGIKGGTISIGRGVVNNRLINFLAINEDRKEIVTMVVENELASEAIKGISDDMHFEKPHHGIAFSYSVSEFIGSKNIISTTQKAAKEGKDMYKVIFVVVDKGRAEEVIDAAVKAGSRSGTIINARGAGIHEVQKFFSVEIEPEKEEVFIITKTENKKNIIDSIIKHMKIDEPGNGILYVLDVNEAYGLF